MADFVPGLELSRAFYEDIVVQMLGGVPHAAALLGSGSDVLGFDTPRSTDHGWGPRLQVFVGPDDVAPVRQRLDGGLPDTFRGWPVRYGWDDVPVTHHVEVATLHDWLVEQVGFDPREGVTLLDWLCTPQQALLELTQGAVHRDDAGELEVVRETLAWYPDDLWLWMLASQWRRLDQEEPFVGRAAEVGDDLGSRILAARLARDLIRLCFLLERRYAPYAKWVGSAFRGLECFAAISPALDDVLAAGGHPEREDALVRAFGAVAALHNARAPTSSVDTTIRPFHSRPYRVLGSGRFVDACLERIEDPRLRSVPPVGAVDQLTDSTDVLDEPGGDRASRAAYAALLG